MSPKEIDCDYMGWINLSHERDRCRVFVCDFDFSGNR
jgi:hypothetical protein